MSQRGSAPRPASRRSPKTSPEAAVSSPRSSQLSPRASILPRDDPQAATHGPGSASGVVMDDGGRPASSGARTSDVHSMLNASELHQQYHRVTAGFVGRPPDPESSRSAIGDPSPRGQGASPFNPYVFQGHPPPPTSQQAYSPLTSSMVPGPTIPNARRGSPTIGPPLPPLGVPRRIATARSPRVASLSRARRAEELQQNPLPRQPSLPGLSNPQDVSPRTGPTVLGATAPRATPQPQGIGPALHPPPHSPVAARSLSQPIVGHALPPAQPGAAGYFHSSNRPSLPGPRQPRIPSQPNLGRDAPVSGPEGETRWSTGSYGSLAGLPWGRGLPSGESRHLLTITPQYGEEIVIPVDTHQGSKTQDQKRQKNAIASARFRTRKKEREHQLEVDNHELQLRVREVEAERDFYRNERNRLRDVVSRVPEISQLANGPPSPVSNRGHGNFSSEGGPMTGNSQSQRGGSDQSINSPPARRRRGPQARSPSRYGSSYVSDSGAMAVAAHPPGRPFAHPPPYVYGGPPPEPSMGEPPARRRRIEHEPQFTTPSYGPPLQQTTLPPMTQTSYGLNLPRLPPTSPGLPRLPPLRMDQPSPTSEHPPQAQRGPGPGAPPPPLPQQVQQQPPYSQAYSRSYEQAPPGQQEGGQR